MAGDDRLSWEVEEACLNAWPSPRHVLIDGYLLRAAGGTSRRINSVNPLRGAGEPERAIDACEAVYAQLGRRPIFRVPDIAGQMQPGLERRGYRALGETRTLIRALNHAGDTPHEAVTVADAPGPDWLALRDEVSGHDAEVARTFRLVTEAILLPRAFVCLAGPEGISAIAFGVRAGPWLVIESVAVREAQRNRGLARQTVGALLEWGRREGATATCLQVEAANAPAVALYRRLGFARELYRYHYRVKA